MSEIVHVFGDLEGHAPLLSASRASKVDKRVVGKLTKFLGRLQERTTVEEALGFVPQAAGPAGRVVLDEATGTLAVRAVVTVHQLHDLGAPLVGAFRLAGERGALWFVEGATDAPEFGHGLSVDDTGQTIRSLTKAELRAVRSHAARAELAALAWRGGPEADAAMARAVATVPEKAKRCIEYYAPQNG